MAGKRPANRSKTKGASRADGPGRPSLYTEEFADRICDALIEGKSLRKICAADDMPDRGTVMRWMATHEDFATKCAHARTLQADLMDDLIIDAAEETTPENAAAQRVKISAYQWRAAKLAPKKYGDSVQLKHADADGEKLPPDDTVVAARMAALMALARARKGSDEGE